MDEAITEDDFYSGPLRGIFSALIRRSVLKDVQTLILDGLSVPVDLIREIVCEDSFSVRLLSIRGAKNLNERRLNQVLRYAIRIDRPTGTPRLKGLYFFGPMSYSNDKGTPFPESTSTNSAIGMELGIQWNHKSQQALAKDLSSGDGKWYQSSGKMFPRTPGQDWADTLQACEGTIQTSTIEKKTAASTLISDRQLHLSLWGKVDVRFAILPLKDQASPEIACLIKFLYSVRYLCIHLALSLRKSQSLFVPSSRLFPFLHGAAHAYGKDTANVAIVGGASLVTPEMKK
ncbi:hypothetical protein MMC20_002024 [Loxospora ochrophaea]|nr:hypothetical protein [Loxospora ochrophaea]